MEKYINPFTDFGFKKIFGEEDNKDLLINFLNTLLKNENDEIKDLVYIKNERLGASEEDRKAIFDLYCENQDGEKFIVELQKVKQEYFKDRSIYYSTFAIQEQAEIGYWNFKLRKVYTISIMDFVFDKPTKKNKQNNKFIHDIMLVDTQDQSVFYDKLRYIYVEMPKFNKKEAELENDFEKWLYILKNLAIFQNMPNSLSEPIFEKVFMIAEIAKYSSEERQIYQNSLKIYRDMKNSIDTAINDGMRQGKKDGIEEGKKLGIEEGKKLGIEEGKRQGVEEGKRQGVEEGKKQGVEEGKKQGVEEGKKQGVEEGKKMGIEEGKKQGVEEGKKQGVEEGIEKGKKQKTIETIKNMIKKNFDNQTIQEIINISFSEIEKIRKEN